MFKVLTGILWKDSCFKSRTEAALEYEITKSKRQLLVRYATDTSNAERLLFGRLCFKTGKPWRTNHAKTNVDPCIQLLGGKT